jgi:hypothetical protein
MEVDREDAVFEKRQNRIRNVTGDDDLIEKLLQSLEENGFINYYGWQRFGNDKEVPSYFLYRGSAAFG